jgi:anti-sigma B factor antagonist
VSVETVEHDGGVRVLRAEGELDVTSVPAVLAGAPGTTDGAAGLVLDLTAVTFFDSSGVRLADRLSREAARAGIGYRVVAPPGSPARRVLELVGLAALLVDDDLATAVRTVGG